MTPEEGAETWRAQAAFNAERSFRQLTDGAASPVQWLSAGGDLIEEVTRATRRCDLVVLGQSAEKGSDNGMNMPVRVALSAGCPILVVPRVGRFPVIGHHVLVAWSDCREAARALNDALPILTAAERTVLLFVNPPDAESHSEDWSGVSDQLSMHGIKATILRSFANRIDIGKVILSRAREASADLVVMGARGGVAGGRLTLGGTTGHVLSHTTLPVLISS
jgi:nucleotide-binding universal stress UspA family protein